MDKILQSVKDVTIRHISHDKIAELNDPNVILSEIGLDSLLIVGYLIDLEATFSITFPSEMIDSNSFKSLESVTESVKLLINLKS